MRRRLAWVAERVGGRLHGDGEIVVSGAATDSREVGPGDLFVALRGARADGQAFLPEVRERGASAALLREATSILPCVVVPDPLTALQRLAAAERREAAFRLVGVTGSLAKTTTKEMLATLLATTFPVGRTRGNRNSEIGLPAELCNQEEGVEWVVAEMGMSHAGELDRLGRIALPDALVYTVVAPVHLEFFPDLDAIAEAKAELLPYLDRDGVLVLNAADQRVASFAPRFAGRVVRYGAPGASDLWIEDFGGRGLYGAEFTLRGPSVSIRVDWGLAGAHQAENLLAAAATAIALGVPPEAVPPTAASMKAAPRRGELRRAASGVTVVDDSYNASPLAMRAMLDLLAVTPGRKVALLGEMLELGEESEALHREVGERARAAADVVITVGGAAAHAMAEAAGGQFVADADAARSALVERLQPGDVVLVKGSRGIHLDAVVDALLEGGR